jgi:thiol-disulfide isomerase/thioredoxin
MKHGKQIAAVLVLLMIAGFIVYGFSTMDQSGETVDAPAANVPHGEPGHVHSPDEALTGVRNGESFGPAAPDFELEAMEGGTFQLSEHLGEVVVLNFWATWCAPCREEIPGFIRLQEEMGDQGVQFVGISLDEEGFSIVRPYAVEMGINYPIIVDDGSVAALFGFGEIYPTTFVINRKGQIVAHIPGLLPEQALRPMLDELIRESV